jgi:hypothetical protein
MVVADSMHFALRIILFAACLQILVGCNQRPTSAREFYEMQGKLLSRYYGGDVQRG